MRGAEATPSGILLGRWAGAPPPLGRRTQNQQGGPRPPSASRRPSFPECPACGSAGLTPWLSGLWEAQEENQTAGLCKRSTADSLLAATSGEIELDRAGSSGPGTLGGAHLHSNQTQLQPCPGSASCWRSKGHDPPEIAPFHLTRAPPGSCHSAHSSAH